MPSNNEIQYWLDRLQEPELLDSAVLLEVEANGTLLAVPVGKWRRGGHIEFLKKSEAKKAFDQLKHHNGFPNLRLITCKDPVTGRPMRYYEVRWGEPAPFDGCDYCEPICGLLLGVHYGYRAEAIADLVEHYQKQTRKPLDRRTVLRIIENVRFHR